MTDALTVVPTNIQWLKGALSRWKTTSQKTVCLMGQILHLYRTSYFPKVFLYRDIFNNNFKNELWFLLLFNLSTHPPSTWQLMPHPKIQLETSKDSVSRKIPLSIHCCHGLLTSQLSFDGCSESWKWDLHHPLPQKPKWLQAAALKSLKLPGTGGSEFPAGQCGPLSNQPRAWVSRTRFSGSMWLRILFPLLSIKWTTKVKAIRVSTKKGLWLFPPCSFCQLKTNQIDEGPQCGPSLAMETLRWSAWRKEGSGI